MEALDTKETSPDNFDKPEFAMRQAFYLGQRKAYVDLVKLLNFLNK